MFVCHSSAQPPVKNSSAQPPVKESSAQPPVKSQVHSIQLRSQVHSLHLRSQVHSLQLRSQKAKPRWMFYLSGGGCEIASFEAGHRQRKMPLSWPELWLAKRFSFEISRKGRDRKVGGLCELNLLQKGSVLPVNWIYASLPKGQCVGLARTIYVLGVFVREITKYTIECGACIRFWPTLDMWPDESAMGTVVYAAENSTCMYLFLHSCANKQSTFSDTPILFPSDHAVAC